MRRTRERGRIREHPAPVTVDVQPLDVDGVRTMSVGTVLWLVAGLAALLFRTELAAAGNEWWLWTCATGTGLGVLGVAYCLSYRRRLRVTVPRQPTDSPSE